MTPFSKLTYTYKRVGDVDIQADVYRSPVDGVRPAIVWLHGGALIFGSRIGIAPEQLSQYLDAGYTVIAADYRLAPEKKLAAIIEDIRDLFKWVQTSGPDLFGIDLDRIAVVGHSAGGYLTLMSGFCVHPRPRALVSFYGYGDIAGTWYSRPDPAYCREPAVPEDEAYRAVGGAVRTGVPWGEDMAAGRFRFYMYCRQHGIWPLEVVGHDPDKEPEQFDRFCPLRNVTGDYPPTLLIHGDRDHDVPFEQSVLMSKELGQQGVEHEFIALADRGHGFDQDGLVDPVVAGVFERVLDFLTNQC